VVLALVVMTGAHWAALQTVAWTTMLANNLCTQSVSKAVAQTFDGEHLCPLCKVIAAAKKSEKKNDASAPTLKQEFPPLAAALILDPPSQFTEMSGMDFFTEPLTIKPPVPPPRSFSV